MDERRKESRHKGVPERDPNRYAPSRAKREGVPADARRPDPSREPARDSRRNYPPARPEPTQGGRERRVREDRAFFPDEPLHSRTAQVGRREEGTAAGRYAPGKAGKPASYPDKNSAKKAAKNPGNGPSPQTAGRPAKDGPNENGPKKAAKKSAKKLSPVERKAAMQKRLSWVILAVVWIAILGIAAFVLRVQSIDVAGLRRFSAEEVREASGLALHSQIYFTDLDGAKKRIEKNPYLVVSSIARVFPDKIVITVREREEKAAIFSQNLAVIVDNEGYVLSIGNRADLSGLIAVEGMQTSGFSVNQRLGDETDFYANTLVAILQALDGQDLAGKIQSIDISNPLRVCMDTLGGVEVLVGQPVDLNDKMEKLAKILPELERLGASCGMLSLSAKGDPVYSPDETLPPSVSASPSPAADPSPSPSPVP